jgi:hypothetical protein
VFRRGVFQRRGRSATRTPAAWSAHFGSRHPSTWGNRSDKSVYNGAARDSAGTDHDAHWEHGGSPTWRADIISCGGRAVLLLLSGRLLRHDVPNDCAWYVLFLLDELHTGVQYAHTDVLHDCATGLSFRAIPSPVRSAHGLYNDSRDDTDLLHRPKLLLYAHDVHVPAHDRTSGYHHQRGSFTRDVRSGVYAHDVHGPERGVAGGFNTAIGHDAIGYHTVGHHAIGHDAAGRDTIGHDAIGLAAVVGSDFNEWYCSVADGSAPAPGASQVMGTQAMGA